MDNEKYIKRDLLRFWVGANDPVDEIARAYIQQGNIDAFEIGRQAGSGFDGLIDLFVNGIEGMHYLTVKHSHKSIDKFIRDMTEIEKQESSNMMTILENEFRQGLYDLILGSDSIFKNN